MPLTGRRRGWALLGLGLAVLTTGCGLAAVEERATGTVPDAYRSYFAVAAQRCPSVLTPAGLAAQARVESGFDPRAVSPAGAEGLMQIIPATWDRFGQDADGDGRADPFSAADSVATAAEINCDLHRTLADVPGNRTEVRLAGYNAGPEAVLRYRGVPPYPETEGYVRDVARWTRTYEDQFGRAAT